MKVVSVLLSVFLMVNVVECEDTCPSQCNCGHANMTRLGWVYVTNCSHAALSYLPEGISPQTQYLDLSHNYYKNLSDTTLIAVRDVMAIDLRGNQELSQVPLFTHNKHLQHIAVDKGSTCCIFEIETEQSGVSVSNVTTVCEATTPYTECSTQLINVFTIIIYFVVVFFSIIFNPWIMIVTVCHGPRRRDPITYNAFHFSTSNLLATIYTAVMLGYGIAYFHDYHYHMESWHNDLGCAFIGFLLITSTLVSAVLYMIEVICIFMKLRFPLKVDRHMTVRRITICVLITWCVALFIASIPFMAERRYNVVGLCLPFYARSENTGFKFVIFYTVIMGITVAVNATLAVLLMKSFVRNRKRRNIEIPQLLVNELILVEKKILVALSLYIAIAIFNVIFLIMSCVGGDVGKMGREWYTRIVVLETITYPLIGPLRAKKFFIDTAKLLRRWNCYEFPGLPTTSSVHGSGFDRAQYSRGSGAHLMKKHDKSRQNSTVCNDSRNTK